MPGGKINLKYLMIYQDSGLPIFSKCFSDFCQIITKDSAIITTFLSFLEDFVEKTIGRAFQSFFLAKTVMRFRKTLPSGHHVIIALEKDNDTVVSKIFAHVEDLLENKYAQHDWTFFSDAFTSEFEKTLYNEVLCPSLQERGGFRDFCPHGDNCPLKTSVSEKRNVWFILKERYKLIKKKIKDI